MMEGRRLLILAVEAIFMFSLGMQNYTQTEFDISQYKYLQEMYNSEDILNITTIPYRYELIITPVFANGGKPSTFDGVVIIHTLAYTTDNKITIHCKNLKIKNAFVRINRFGKKVSDSYQKFHCTQYNFLTINLTEDMIINRNYTIVVYFKGEISPHTRGFYKTSYNEFMEVGGSRKDFEKHSSKFYMDVGERWMAATMLEGGDTRNVFPCFDDPFFKAVFSITIHRPPDFSPSLSNMPIAKTRMLRNGLVAETFHDTPITSTYLIAFVISRYKVVAQNKDPLKPITVYAPPYGKNFGDYAVEVAEKFVLAMDEHTQLPYFEMAAHMEIKMVVIPDLGASAMENWGLITFREQFLLCDPLDIDYWNKQTIVTVITHELSHMWFGNLVSCAWWDNLWLKEGLARFYEYYIPDSVFPEFEFMKRFAVEQVHTIMELDCDSLNTFPLSKYVFTRREIEGHFGPITYLKGASILKMTMDLIGKDRFDKAIRFYLNDRKYNVVYPYDLFFTLNYFGTAKYGSDLGITTIIGFEKVESIKKYLKNWIYESGYPLLTVTVNQTTGYMNVTQSRFYCASNKRYDTIYYIPITWYRAGEPDFENLKPSLFLTERSIIIDRNSTGNEWVIFNKQQSGYYRVNYDINTWKLIAKALKSPERKLIHENNRAQIVDDLFKLAKHSVVTYTTMFKVLSFLKYEDQYAPWVAAIRGYKEMLNTFKYNWYTLQKFKKIIISQTKAVVQRIGYYDRENDIFMDGLLRLQLMKFLCNIGHKECIETSKHYFELWQKHGKLVPANMRPWVYCTALRHGTSSQYEFFISQIQRFTLYNEKLMLIEAMGCTTIPISLHHSLNIILGSEQKIQKDFFFENDWANRFQSVLEKHSDNIFLVFDWVKEYLRSDTLNYIRMYSGVHMVYEITANVCDDVEVDKITSWLDTAFKQNDSLNIVSKLRDTIEEALEVYRAKKEFHDSRISEISQYFRTVFYKPEPPKIPVLLQFEFWKKVFVSVSIFGLIPAFGYLIVRYL